MKIWVRACFVTSGGSLVSILGGLPRCKKNPSNRFGQVVGKTTFCLGDRNNDLKDIFTVGPRKIYVIHYEPRHFFANSWSFTLGRVSN